MKSYDIVIPLGEGSQHEDRELRYCLRSIVKYYPEHGDIYIIGRRPSWLKNTCFIRAIDTPGMEHKESNIKNKILLAQSKEFIFFNDDHFLTKPLKKLPYYHMGTLEDTIKKRSGHDHYYHSLKNTADLFHGGLNFDVHCPIIYNYDKFKEIVNSFPWNVYGYVIKSLYSNSLGITGEQIEDLKINQSLNCFQIEKLIGDRPFFSIGDKSINADMFTYLQYLYPLKSEFEK